MEFSPEDIRKGQLIKAAVGAMIKALEGFGADNDNTSACTAVGLFMGCIAGAHPDPKNVLAGMNEVANGVIDGNLLK